MKEFKQLGKVNCQEPGEQQYVFTKLITALSVRAGTETSQHLQPMCACTTDG